MGVILANFRSSGNFPFAILLFIKEAIGLYIIGAESLSNLGPIESIPAAFDVSLNPGSPRGHLRKYSIEKTWYCIHGNLIN